MTNNLATGSLEAEIKGVTSVLVQISQEIHSTGRLTPCEIPLTPLVNIVQFAGMKYLANIGPVFAFELPAHVRDLNYQGDTPRPRKCRVPVPNLVFIWHGASRDMDRTFRVLIHSDSDPEYEKLVPFEVSNVFDDGHVCFGAYRGSTQPMTLVGMFLEAPFNDHLKLKPHFVSEAGWTTLRTNFDAEVRGHGNGGSHGRWFTDLWPRLSLSQVQRFNPPRAGKPLMKWLLETLVGHGGGADTSCMMFRGVPYLAIRKSSIAGITSLTSIEDADRVLLHITDRKKMYMYPLQAQGETLVAKGPGGDTLPIHGSSKLRDAEAMKLAHYFHGSVSVDVVRTSFQNAINGLQRNGRTAAPPPPAYHVGAAPVLDAVVDQVGAALLREAEAIRTHVQPFIGTEQVIALNDLEPARSMVGVLAEVAPHLFLVRLGPHTLVMDSLRLRDFWTVFQMDRAYELRDQGRNAATRDVVNRLEDFLNGGMRAYHRAQAGHDLFVAFGPGHPQHGGGLVWHGIRLPNGGWRWQRGEDAFEVPQTCDGFAVGSEKVLEYLLRCFWNLGSFTAPLTGDQFVYSLVQMLWNKVPADGEVQLRLNRPVSFRALNLPEGAVVTLKRDRGENLGIADYVFTITALPEGFDLDAADANLRVGYNLGKAYKMTVRNDSQILRSSTAVNVDRWPYEWLVNWPVAEAPTLAELKQNLRALGLTVPGGAEPVPDPDTSVLGYAQEQLRWLSQPRRSPNPVVDDGRAPVRPKLPPRPAPPVQQVFDIDGTPMGQRAREVTVDHTGRQGMVAAPAPTPATAGMFRPVQEDAPATIDEIFAGFTGDRPAPRPAPPRPAPPAPRPGAQPVVRRMVDPGAEAILRDARQAGVLFNDVVPEAV